MRHFDVLMFAYLCQFWSITCFSTILLLTSAYELRFWPTLFMLNGRTFLKVANAVSMQHTMLALAYDRLYTTRLQSREKIVKGVTCIFLSLLCVCMTGDYVVASMIPVIMFSRTSLVVCGALLGTYAAWQIIDHNINCLSVLVTVPLVLFGGQRDFHMREIGRSLALILALGGATCISSVRMRLSSQGGLTQMQ